MTDLFFFWTLPQIIFLSCLFPIGVRGKMNLKNGPPDLFKNLLFKVNVDIFRVKIHCHVLQFRRRLNNEPSWIALSHAFTSVWPMLLQVFFYSGKFFFAVIAPVKNGEFAHVHFWSKYSSDSWQSWAWMTKSIHVLISRTQLLQLNWWNWRTWICTLSADSNSWSHQIQLNMVGFRL